MQPQRANCGRRTAIRPFLSSLLSDRLCREHSEGVPDVKLACCAAQGRKAGGRGAASPPSQAACEISKLKLYTLFVNE